MKAVASTVQVVLSFSLIIIVAGSDAPLNDNSGPTTGTYHARAQNAVRHSLIIGPNSQVSFDLKTPST